jgi:hypothetical protein
MATTTIYKLTGGGGGAGPSVSLTYATDASGLSITLDDSFSYFRGGHGLEEKWLTVTQPTQRTFEVSGIVETMPTGGQHWTHRLAIKLFLAAPQPSAASTPAQSTGLVVLAFDEFVTTPFRAVPLTGTSSVTDTADGG